MFSPHTTIQYKTHTYTPPHVTKIYKTTQYNYKQIQYNHTITIPTISTPTLLHKPHTSIQYKNPHIHTPTHYKNIQNLTVPL